MLIFILLLSIEIKWPRSGLIPGTDSFLRHPLLC